MSKLNKIINEEIIKFVIGEMVSKKLPVSDLENYYNKEYAHIYGDFKNITLNLTESKKNIGNVDAKKCEGKTKSGEDCKRNAVEGSTFCKMHHDAKLGSPTTSGGLTKPNGSPIGNFPKPGGNLSPIGNNSPKNYESPPKPLFTPLPVKKLQPKILSPGGN